MDANRFPAQIDLRDGSTVTVRPMERTDSPAMLAFFKALPDEDRLFLRNDVTRPDVVDRFVNDLDHELVLGLVVEADGHIIASATLQRERYGWMTHIGEMRLVIAHSFQRKGLGIALVRMLVTAAASTGLDLIVARLMDGQIGAMHAIEQLGFRHEAVLRNHVRDISGRRRDLHIYTNDVSLIWESMERLNSDFSPCIGD